MRKHVISGSGPFLAGVVFALGLSISGMTEPSKILGFLDVAGDWDVTLIFVMASATLVYSVLFRLIVRRPMPIFEKEFYIPKKTNLDKKLIIGAIIFDIGWGLSGLCPGLGITSLVTGTMYAVSFVVAMLLGMFIVKRFVNTFFNSISIPYKNYEYKTPLCYTG